MKTIATERLMAGSIFDEQVKLEMEYIQAGIMRYRRLRKEAEERGDAALLKPAQRLLVYWFDWVKAGIAEERDLVARGVPGPDRTQYGRYLWLLDEDRMAAVVIHRMLGSLLIDGCPQRTLAYTIGRDVIAEAQKDILKNKHRDEWKAMERRIKRIQPRHINHLARKTLEDPIWRRKLCYKLGAVLVAIFAETASVSGEGEPFESAIQTETFMVKRGAKRKLPHTRVVFHPRVGELVEEGHEIREAMRPRYGPMIVPPCRWVDGIEGNYLRIRAPLISKITRGQKSALSGAEKGRLYEGLDCVNQQPWRINLRVLGVVRQLWDMGGNVVGLPGAEQIPMPPIPDDFHDNEESKKEWKKVATDIHAKRLDAASARKVFLRSLSTAEEWCGRERFYLPHQLDFRGRVYPLPTGVNHHHADIQRGMLEFPDAVPLGSDGERWLKVCTSGHFGYDKETLENRVAWVDSKAKDIELVARDPIANDWWHEAEDPFQFLTCCLALCGDGAEHMPGRIDGSCNGLQHFAALGRDAEGGRNVNLVPGLPPQDVYLKGLAEVLPVLEASDSEYAPYLIGKVDRAEVKTPFMTWSYGVTKAGARAQIRDALAKRLPELERKTVNKCASVLTTIVMDTVPNVVPAAYEIMEWMREVARLIVTQNPRHRRPVIWTSPIGLPVVQPYKRHGNREWLDTVLAHMWVHGEGNENRAKHVQGFAPNYIHSVDASHMMNTAIRCREQGIDYAAVHDAYWTHLGNLGQLQRNVLDEFVTLHRQPLLENLLAELKAKNDHVEEWPELPETGSLDIEAISGCTYAFV